MAADTYHYTQPKSQLEVIRATLSKRKEFLKFYEELPEFLDDHLPMINYAIQLKRYVDDVEFLLKTIDK